MRPAPPAVAPISPYQVNVLHASVDRRRDPGVDDGRAAHVLFEHHVLQVAVVEVLQLARQCRVSEGRPRSLRALRTGNNAAVRRRRSGVPSA
eukprot:scaffold1054_cov366-Prasinococcus_capsulatus_cf.AAC.13